jgi:hypothetical protein
VSSRRVGFFCPAVPLAPEQVDLRYMNCGSWDGIPVFWPFWTSSTLNVAYVVLGFVYGILDPVLVYWATLACCVVSVFFYLRATAVYALVLARVIFMAAISTFVVCAIAVPTDPLRYTMFCNVAEPLA